MDLLESPGWLAMQADCRLHLPLLVLLLSSAAQSTHLCSTPLLHFSASGGGGMPLYCTSTDFYSDRFLR
uniref:Uncharacterized protein n=1 Tax=Arundo donax TaxID=35708 RepID=A0A0A9PS37_ARUDO